MAKLTVKQKHWLLSAHIIFAALWTGTVLSMFLLSWTNKQSNNPEVLYALHSAVNLLDEYVVIPAATGSVLTATFLCWLTNYGFMKFWWVISKWFLTISLVVFGTFWLYPWSNTAEEIAQEQGLSAFSDRVYSLDIQGVFFGAAVQAILLVVIIGISVIKPWGRQKIINHK
ncbi:conserved membrane hypothetical protein [Hyella patelloides LEGE 07179]|uniref:Integral membrane protein n=1 Tax=Hyella patelloides LEGE 07179 TaxID=945734 RepID=A0A563VTM6_9CYAN|nr:DUF2269 family protein [Hyella patelloides]VEP14832.1 conserved membrane hypothetical protein [Hyella patelloides LEGE 07179]